MSSARTSDRPQAMQRVLRIGVDGLGEWFDPQSGRPVRGPLAEAPAFLREGARVLVPGEDVLIAVVEIAARQRHRLLQAIPYAVEDQLIDEVDRHHFALGQALGNDRHLVAAVARDRMEAWLTALDDAGIQATSLVPDTLAVPNPDEAAVLVLDGDRTLLRAGQGTAMAAGGDEVAAYLALLETPALRVLGSGDPPALDRSVDREDADMPALAILARHDLSGALDLRQGAFAPRRSGAGRSRRLWVVAVALLALAVVAETVGRALETWSRSRAASVLEAQSAAILTDRFPEISRVVDARIQMQQAIDELRGTGGSGGALSLLRLAGPPLAGDTRVRIESVSYRSGELLVAVQADDLRRIEALRQRLVGRQLAAQIESANALDDRTTARIRIGGAP